MRVMSIPLFIIVYLFGSILPSQAEESAWVLFMAAINAAKNNTTCNQANLCTTKADCLLINGYWYDEVNICSSFSTSDHLLRGSWKDSWDETYVTYYPDGTFYGTEFGFPFQGVWAPISVDTVLRHSIKYDFTSTIILLNESTYIYENIPSLGEYSRTDIYEPTTVISAGQVWMDRNLGASRVATSLTDSKAYGDLYQWGRLTDGHEKRNSSTTRSLSSFDVPGHDRFILNSSSPGDWRAPQNDNLWQGVKGINNPCPDGFRLPTEIEWETEKNSWSGTTSHCVTVVSYVRLIRYRVMRRIVLVSNVLNNDNFIWRRLEDLDAR